MARFNRWDDDLAAALAEPFAKELHAQKDKKGTFVAIHHYTRRLNDLVGPGGWSMLPPVPYEAGSKLGLAVGIEILGVAKWNVGDEMEDHGEPVEVTDKYTGEVKEKVVDFGSSSTNSFAQAFKRCCSLFGLGLYLYDKEWTKKHLAAPATRTPTPASRASAPQTTTPAGQSPDAGSLKHQTEEITKLLAEREVDADSRTKTLNVMDNGLTWAKADNIIKHLKTFPVAKASAA